jgi:hypothetical protein
VQGWLNDPASNSGWLLQSQSESTATSILRFASRDDLAGRPALTIQFTPVPEPGTVSLAVLALGVGAIFLRRSKSA